MSLPRLLSCVLGALAVACSAPNPAYRPGRTPPDAEPAPAFQIQRDAAAPDLAPPDLAPPDLATRDRPVAPDAAPAPAGLKGEYFDNLDFTAPKATRIDPVIDFEWLDRGPVDSVAPNTFSVRWTGQVQAAFSEKYSFQTTSDDGVRLWVNGQLLIDDWFDHPVTEDTGTITLVAGRRYDIKLEYFEDFGTAQVHLSWSSPSTPRQIVPSTRLTPAP